MNRFFLVIAGTLLILIEAQIFSLLYLHGLNLKMWGAQSELNESFGNILTGRCLL